MQATPASLVIEVAAEWLRKSIFHLFSGHIFFSVPKPSLRKGSWGCGRVEGQGNRLYTIVLTKVWERPKPKKGGECIISSKGLDNGATVWFTGLPSSGKTTISRSLFEKLTGCGYKTELLDGDILRQSISKGLGYSRDDRNENIRRIGSMAEQLARSGFIVLVAVISPYRSSRDELREAIPNFIEVYVNAPLDICEKRDVKGLYCKARKGEILHFTGIDDPYEHPLSPEVVCYTDRETVEESVTKVIECLRRVKIIK